MPLNSLHSPCSSPAVGAYAQQTQDATLFRGFFHDTTTRHTGDTSEVSLLWSTNCHEGAHHQLVSYSFSSRFSTFSSFPCPCMSRVLVGPSAEKLNVAVVGRDMEGVATIKVFIVLCVPLIFSATLHYKCKRENQVSDCEFVHRTRLRRPNQALFYRVASGSMVQSIIRLSIPPASHRIASRHACHIRYFITG